MARKARREPFRPRGNSAFSAHPPRFFRARIAAAQCAIAPVLLEMPDLRRVLSAFRVDDIFKSLR